MGISTETKIAFVVGVAIGLPVIALFVVSLLPTWFAIMGTWASYIDWVSIILPITRILWFICIPIFTVAGVFFNSSYILILPEVVLLAIWGVPVLQTNLIALASIELPVLELQRALLQVIVINATSLHISSTIRSVKKNEKGGE